ncbi:MAG: RNA polymerase sigma factor SigJ [Kofleriaceae bacterium]
MTATALAAEFEVHRDRLFGIAYRMLGSAAEADDVLQEAHLRWLAVDRAGVVEPRAYLVTVVTRLALDVLGSARVRRETYPGPWLPEPIATAPQVDGHDLSLLFLHVLERLSPAERAAFLLAEVFDYSHREVAAILGKSEAACRQLAARARRQVKDGRPRAVDPDVHDRVLAAFVAACSAGDLAGLERLLAADCVVLSDGGGRVAAATRVVRGAAAASRLLLGLARKGAGVLTPRPVRINGAPALALYAGAALDTVLTCAVVDGHLAAVCLVRNPDKLRAVAVARTLA